MEEWYFLEKLPNNRVNTDYHNCTMVGETVVKLNALFYQHSVTKFETM